MQHATGPTVILDPMMKRIGNLGPTVGLDPMDTVFTEIFTLPLSRNQTGRLFFPLLRSTANFLRLPSCSVEVLRSAPSKGPAGAGRLGGGGGGGYIGSIIIQKNKDNGNKNNNTV